MTISGRIEELNRAAEEIEQELERMPEGTLILENDRARCRMPDGRRETVNPVHEEQRMKDLARKAYLRDVLAAVKQEQYAWRQFQKHCPEQTYEFIYSDLPEKRKELVQPFETAQMRKWERGSYRRNQKFENEKAFMCSNGIRVRSKSEHMIAERLIYYHIPFRYECGLKLDGSRWVYPDFTIWKMHEDQILYWEHFGMADDEKYRLNMIKKLVAYQRNNIGLGGNLIATVETYHYPLTQEAVDSMIQTKLLG